MRTLWVLASVFAAGCGDGENTSCTVGTLLCTDSRGEVTQDGDAQLRECTDDSSRGGDEDGEFVVVEDCAAEGNACYVEFFGTGGEDRGGCITRECADDGIVDCLAAGTTMCSGFGGLLVCGTEPVSGCQRWIEDTACADAGGTCVEQGGEAICETG